MNSRDSISRRDFLRYACAGAGALTLTGCATSGRRSTVKPARLFDPNQDLRPLTTEELFRQIANAALDASKAEILFLRLTHETGTIAHFDDERIHGDEAFTRHALTIVLGNPNEPLRTATIDTLTPEAAADAVKALENGDVPHADAESIWGSSNLPPQRYLVLPTYRLDTATASAERCAAEANRVRNALKPLGVRFDGVLETARGAFGAANRQGLFAYEARTRTGWRLEAGETAHRLPIAALHRSIDDLETVETIRRWAPALRVLNQERTLTPGRYTAVFGPEAAAQLAHRLPNGEEADSVRISSEFTIRNYPQHPALLGCGFDADGFATDALPRIERGIPFCSRTGGDVAPTTPHGVAGIRTPDALYVYGSNSSDADVAELIRTVDRGLYIARVARPELGNADRAAGKPELTDIFMIENGALTGVARIPLQVDPVRIFAGISLYTPPLPAAFDLSENNRSSGAGTYKAFAPALTVADFEIS